MVCLGAGGRRGFHNASSSHAGGTVAEKKTKRVVHRDRPDVIEAKGKFFTDVVTIPTDKLVFIDEMGVNLAMTPTMARAPIGKRAVGVVPMLRASNVSVAAAVRGDDVIAWHPHDGAVDGERFAAFITDRVAPKLRIGDVVVMDNVKFHKSPEIQAIIERVGARILFIPAYHPELNAIEEAFSVVKRLVRRLEPRTILELIDALRHAFGSLSSTKLSAFIKHMLSFAIQPT